MLAEYVRVRLRNRWRFCSNCGKKEKRKKEKEKKTNYGAAWIESSASSCGSFKDGRSRFFVSSARGSWKNFHGPVIPLRDSIWE